MRRSRRRRSGNAEHVALALHHDALTRRRALAEDPSQPAESLVEAVLVPHRVVGDAPHLPDDLVFDGADAAGSIRPPVVCSTVTLPDNGRPCASTAEPDTRADRIGNSMKFTLVMCCPTFKTILDASATLAVPG